MSNAASHFTPTYSQMQDLWLLANRGEQAMAASSMRKLENAGLVRRTGRKVGNSTVFALTAEGREVASRVSMACGRMVWNG